MNAYTGWGAYGASKAVLNHLALTLATEESKVTTVSIRPGTVDTEMQREIREVYHGNMDEKDAVKFASLKATGALLKPYLPGHVIAKLALHAPKELSGRFLRQVVNSQSFHYNLTCSSWNDKDLSDFQAA